MPLRSGWTVKTVGLSGAIGIVVLAWAGCASVDSIFVPPPAPKVPAPAPPPPVRPEPVSPPPVKTEPPPSPPKKEAEPSPPPQKVVPETPTMAPAPPPTKPPTPPPPPAPVKREPVKPSPPKKEPEPGPPAKGEPQAPAKKEPETPPPVLAPQVGKAREEQLRRTTSSRIQRSEEVIGQLEGKTLTSEQREQLLTAKSLVGSAREALASEDLTKASNLAEKARILVEELAQTVH